MLMSDTDTDDNAIGLAERAMAELLRRKAQQKQVQDATDSTREFDQSIGKADGYQTAVDILSEMAAAERAGDE